MTEFHKRIKKFLYEINICLDYIYGLMYKKRVALIMSFLYFIIIVDEEANSFFVLKCKYKSNIVTSIVPSKHLL